MKAFIFVGPPGSGKSSYAKKLATEHDAVIVSGDDIRQDLYGSAQIQGNWGEIWERIEEKVAENVGRVLIMDGTHCRKDYRSETITLLRSYGYTNIVAVVMSTSLATCLARNFKRVERSVPDYVIKEMYGDLQRSVHGIEEEGFSYVVYV